MSEQLLESISELIGERLHLKDLFSKRARFTIAFAIVALYAFTWLSAAAGTYYSKQARDDAQVKAVADVQADVKALKPQVQSNTSAIGQNSRDIEDLKTSRKKADDFEKKTIDTLARIEQKVDDIRFRR